MMIAISSALLISACSNPPLDQGKTAPSALNIEANESSVSFTTTKAGAPGVGGVVDTMHFKRYSGGMDATGKIRLEIDLASIDSGIAIRDDRLRNLLWNVKATPSAVFTAQLPANALAQIGQGSQSIDLEGQLQMAGQSRPIKASLRVATLPNKRIWVSSRQPIVVNANDFGLREGVEALRQSVGLHFLASSASVNLNLALNPL